MDLDGFKLLANTRRHRPRGVGWVHLVRENLEAHSYPKLLAEPGRWYADERTKEASEQAAIDFAVWSERQLRDRSDEAQRQYVDRLQDRARAFRDAWARKESPDSALPWERWPAFTLWVCVPPDRSLSDFQRPGVARCIRELFAAAANDPDAETLKRFGTGTTTLYGCNLGKYESRLSGDGEPNIYLGEVTQFSKEAESVTLLAVRERVRKAVDSVEKAVEAVLPNMPTVPRLDELKTPSAKVDGRSSKIERSFAPARLDDYLQGVRESVGIIHDGVLVAFQKVLDELSGTACPLREQNQRLASEIIKLADSFACGLFFQTAKGDVKQIRLGTRSEERGRSGSLADAAGLFTLRSVGRTTWNTTVATFPALVAARDQAQAEAIFAARDAESAS